MDGHETTTAPATTLLGVRAPEVTATDDVAALATGGARVHGAAPAHGSAPAEAAELPNVITLIEHAYPKSPVSHFMVTWENEFFAFGVMLFLVFVLVRATRGFTMLPDAMQNLVEAVVEGLNGFVCGVLGPAGRKHTPFVGTLFLYILLMNWSGLIPFMKSPTAAWSTTVTLGLAVMLYVQWTGIKEQGPGHYALHLCGSPKNMVGFVLMPLMLVINLTIEYLAVPLSLSLRLFANVSSEDKLLFKFAELNVLYGYTPFLLQLFANCLAVAFSFVQAFVFMLLTTVYLSLVTPHHEESHGDLEESDGHNASHAPAH